MSKQQQYNAGGMRAMTMLREYGSGGGEVAAGEGVSELRKM